MTSPCPPSPARYAARDAARGKKDAWDMPRILASTPFLGASILRPSLSTSLDSAGGHADEEAHTLTVKGPLLPVTVRELAGALRDYAVKHKKGVSLAVQAHPQTQMFNSVQGVVKGHGKLRAAEWPAAGDSWKCTVERHE